MNAAFWELGTTCTNIWNGMKLNGPFSFCGHYKMPLPPPPPCLVLAVGSVLLALLPKMTPLHCLKTITKSDKDAFIPWNTTIKKALMTLPLTFSLPFTENFVISSLSLPYFHTSTERKGVSQLFDSFGNALRITPQLVMRVRLHPAAKL